MILSIGIANPPVVSCVVCCVLCLQEALERKARMQFTLQLSNIEDPRKAVLVQQNKIRFVCGNNNNQLTTVCLINENYNCL